MLLRFLIRNQIWHFALIPLIVGALWFRSFLHPEFFSFFEGENGMPLYHIIRLLTDRIPLLNSLLAAVILLVLAFIILRLNTLYSFIRMRTFLPSIIFVFIVSGIVSLHTLHPVYPGVVFMLLCVSRIFGAGSSGNMLSTAFEAGFFLSIGSLFYLNMLFYAPVIWTGMLMMSKNRNWRIPILSCIGLILPWFFTWTWYYFAGNTAELESVVILNFQSLQEIQFDTLPFRIYVGFLILLTLWGLVVILRQYDTQNINRRKYFQLFFLIFAISIAMYFLLPAVAEEILVALAIPMTFLISNYLISIRSRVWGELIILVFLGLTTYMQFV
ncbi:MAG: DUF6427 family protein [Bacteroidales bacterium]|jgi:hypothetical protein|nr:DUF6427 family protein [Bacteroidales bacterium]